jgi:integrase
MWDSVDLQGRRVFVEHQATHQGDEDTTKSENALRTVPLPAYLIPELKRWKLACPPTERGLCSPADQTRTACAGQLRPTCFSGIS